VIDNKDVRWKTEIKLTAAGSSPEPSEPNPYILNSFINIHFNSFFPSTPMFFNEFLTSAFWTSIFYSFHLRMRNNAPPPP
jgi:hypothetical protein